MIEKKFLPEERIMNCLEANYGIKDAVLTHLPLGADMNALIYKAKASSKLSYFVKIKMGHHHDISIDIVEFLHNAGLKEIIAPVQTNQGHSTLLVDDFTVIVYPFIEGQDGFSRNLRHDQWVTLGKALRQIHEIDIPLSIQNRLRRETYSPKWRKIVRSLYTHATHPSGDEIAMKLWTFLKDNATTIHRLVDRADQLAQKLQTHSPLFVLCHSDIHGGNVLIDKDDSLYIVDWDEPMMAPKERDLMFIGGGVANVWNKPDEEMLFYQGYGKIEVNRELLAYYRYERIVEDIADYRQMLLMTTAGENRPILFKHFMDMFEPRGVVDIAFKTDDEMVS